MVMQSGGERMPGGGKRAESEAELPAAMPEGVGLNFGGGAANGQWQSEGHTEWQTLDNKGGVDGEQDAEDARIDKFSEEEEYEYAQGYPPSPRQDSGSAPASPRGEGADVGATSDPPLDDQHSFDILELRGPGAGLKTSKMDKLPDLSRVLRRGRPRKWTISQEVRLLAAELDTALSIVGKAQAKAANVTLRQPASPGGSTTRLLQTGAGIPQSFDSTRRPQTAGGTGPHLAASPLENRSMTWKGWSQFEGVAEAWEKIHSPKASLPYSPEFKSVQRGGKSYDFDYPFLKTYNLDKERGWDADRPHCSASPVRSAFDGPPRARPLSSGRTLPSSFLVATNSSNATSTAATTISSTIGAAALGETVQPKTGSLDTMASLASVGSLGSLSSAFANAVPRFTPEHRPSTSERIGPGCYHRNKSRFLASTGLGATTMGLVDTVASRGYTPSGSRFGTRRPRSPSSQFRGPGRAAPTLPVKPSPCMFPADELPKSRWG